MDKYYVRSPEGAASFNERGIEAPQSMDILAVNNAIVFTSDGAACQSYGSIIAYRCHDGQVILDRGTWDYSATTGKHRNAFLGEGIADTREKIKDGTYWLADLN